MKLYELLKNIDDKINEYLKAIKRSRNQVKIVFRGEPIDYGDTKLMPSISRDSYNEKKLLDLLVDFGVSKADKNLYKMIDSQHYLSVSRLLDVSMSVLPAIFFACQSIENNKETMNGQLYIIVLPDNVSPSANELECYITNLINDKKNNDIFTFKNNYKLISNSNLNDRVKNQHAGFILFTDYKGSYSPLMDGLYICIEIKGDDKKSILDELESFFNIHPGTIYPEKDKMSDYIKKHSKTRSEDLDSLKREINSYIDLVEIQVNYANSLKNSESEMKKKEIYKRINSQNSAFVKQLEIFIKNKNNDNTYYDQLLINTKLLLKKLRDKII